MSTETSVPAAIDKSRQRGNSRIVFVTWLLLIAGTGGLVWVFIAGFRHPGVPIGKPLPATACSTYGCCRVTSLFTKNQVNVYFEFSDLKVRDDLTLHKGQLLVLSVDESNAACNRAIKAADTTRGFFLNLTACETVNQ